jgi:hypothetical protein
MGEIFFINGDQIIFCPEFGRIDCKSNPIGQPIIPDGFSRFDCLQRLGYVAGSSETFYGLTECIGGKGTVQAVEVQSDARRDSNLFVDRQPEPMTRYYHSTLVLLLEEFFLGAKEYGAA